MDLVKAPERTHNVASIDRVENWAALYTTSIAMKVGGCAHAGDCNVGLPARRCFLFSKKGISTTTGAWCG